MRDLFTKPGTADNPSIILSILVLFCVCGCGCGCRADKQTGTEDWLLFRGNVELSGSTAASLPEHPVVLWTYKSGERTSSSPVVCDGTVYWSDKRGHIRGVGADGKRRFDYSFNTAVEASPMIRDSVLYIGRIDGFMSALSLATRDTLWNFETLGQISASANTGVFNGRQAVVFGSYDNFLYCVDRENGREIGRFETGYYINGAVALGQDCFVSGGCDARLRIIGATGGKASDSLLLDTYIPASPAIDGAYVYVSDHSGNVYETVLEEGKTVRSRKMVEATDGGESSVSVPALSAPTLFVLSGDRHLYAIDRITGNVRWKYLQKGPSGESSPVVCNDKVITCSKNGIVSLLDASDGSLLWEYDTGEQIAACPAVITGRFYILTAKGMLFCFGSPNGASSSFSSMKDSFSSMNDSFSSMNNSFSSMNNFFSSMNNFFSSMNNFFSSMNNSFSSMNNSFSSMNNSFSSMGGSFSSMNNSFSSMNDSFSSMGGSFSSMNGSLNGTDISITTII
jgi:outer membrane protein assembly factor BamB